jgi:hypothetical protein
MSFLGRRTKLLIEPYQQIRFGLVFLFLNFIFSVLVLSVFGYYMWDMFSAIKELFLLKDPQIKVVASKFFVPASIGAGLVLVFVVATLYFAARYTHQIYGPLVSIRRFLDQIIAGESPQAVSIRKTDQLQDLVTRLNIISKQYSESSDSKSIKKVCDYIDALEKGKKISIPVFDVNDPLYDLAQKLEKLTLKL